MDQPRKSIQPIADKLAFVLAGVCKQCVVAGAIRRKADRVGGVLLVTIPKMEHPGAGLFSEPTSSLDPMLADLERSGKLVPAESHLSSLGVRRYTAPNRDPAVTITVAIVDDIGWGAMLAYYTGPITYSGRLCKPTSCGGLLPEDYGVFNDHLWVKTGTDAARSEKDQGRLINRFAYNDSQDWTLCDTPTEESFYDRVAGGWIKPEHRI